MDVTLNEDRVSDGDFRLDFAPADVWFTENADWAADLPDLALPPESLGLSDDDHATAIVPGHTLPVIAVMSVKMKLGIATSFLVHATLIGVSLLGLYWVAPLEAGDVESIAVDIVETQSVASNATTSVESDAVESMVSSGAEAIEPIEAETIEEVPPVETTTPETLTPVEVEDIAEPVEQVTPEPVEVTEPIEQDQPPEIAEAAPVEPLEPIDTPVEPVAAQTVAAEDPLLAATPIEPLADVETIAPLEAVTPIEPVETTLTPVTDSTAAPVPLTRTVAQLTEPTIVKKPAPKKPEPEQPAPKKPAPKKPAPEAAPTKKQRPTAAGNAGANEADAQASAQSSASKGSSGGGSGSADKYTGRVLAKLRRSLRYPSGAKGATGDVAVQFTIAGGGGVSGVRVVGSSGNAVLDDAAIATVNRAAPFPEIPAESGKSSWTFTMPLGFVR